MTWQPPIDFFPVSALDVVLDRWGEDLLPPKTDGFDPVERPAHYVGSGAIECIEVVEQLGLGYHLGNAVKYIWRAGKKTADPLEDLAKARWYLDRYIQKLEEGKG